MSNRGSRERWNRHSASVAAQRRTRRRRLLVLLVLLLAAAVGVTGYLSGWRTAPEAETPTTTEPPLTKLVFPEGLRREEMAAILAERTNLSAERYLELTGPSARGEELSGRSVPTSLEGFLFPATYEIGTETTVEFLVDQQIRAYERAEQSIDQSYAASRNLTPYDVLIIASMVEREVRVPSERPIVAGVMYNRLRAGMRLDIDATVQYATGRWGTITGSDLRHPSPYNTRLHKGLPPGPIASPGEASLRAAAAPAEHDYLYYVARDDGSGGHRFAKTLEEFTRIQQEG